MTDTDTPKRIRQLDFSDRPEQLEYFLGALNSSSISVTSSIRLRSTQSIDPGEYLTRFLSLSFPKLSNLDIENFLPDSSSPIFTTSNLSSLKLRSPYDILPHYTLAQVSQVLHRHSDLRELDFEIGAAPLIESPDAPVPFPLPQLVNLRLYATETAIARLIDLVRMSSPLHNVTIHFHTLMDKLFQPWPMSWGRLLWRVMSVRDWIFPAGPIASRFYQIRRETP